MANPSSRGGRHRGGWSPMTTAATPPELTILAAYPRKGRAAAGSGRSRESSDGAEGARGPAPSRLQQRFRPHSLKGPAALRARVGGWGASHHPRPDRTRLEPSISSQPCSGNTRRAAAFICQQWTLLCCCLPASRRARQRFQLQLVVFVPGQR